MNWYPLSEPSYQLTHHHHHYQPFEYVPLTITSSQAEYVNTDLQKSNTTGSSPREDEEYECSIEHRLFPKNNNEVKSSLTTWVPSNNGDMCLIKDL